MYWEQIECTYRGYLSKAWDEFYQRYGDGGYDPWMLTIHSIRAGHLGSSEDKERARNLVDGVVSPGVWNPEISSWNVARYLPEIGSHPSVDSRYVEALYYAWKYRDLIGLSPSQVAKVVEVLCAKAESAYSREDWHNQENAYWYNNAIYIAWEVTGERKYAEFWQEYMDHFVNGIDKPSPWGFNYLWPDFSWRYSDHMAFEALEYGLMCYGGMINYQRMHDQGLYSFTDEQLSKVRGYQQYALCMWRLDGYPNWDTGYGHERLLNSEYWAFGLRALVALIYAHSVNARPEDRHYARYLFDRGLELFARMDTWDGDPEDGAVPLQPYGTGSLFGDKFSANCLFIAELCMAIDLGLLRVEPLNPTSLWRYNWYHQKLAVSTESYSTTIVPLGMRRFDYGGLELTGLCDGQGRSLTISRSSHYPRAWSFEIPEEIPVRTHNVGLTATPDNMPRTSEGEEYFAVVESPDGELTNLVEYDTRIFTPTFERLVAKGHFATQNYRYDTRFTFERDRLRIDRELLRLGQARRGRVVATIPLSQWIEKVLLVDSSGRSRLIVDGDAEFSPALGLGDIAYIDFEGEETGFIIAPTRMRLGASTAAWARQLEGASIYVGKHCRTVFLCLAGFGAGEPIERIIFDALYIITDGSPEDAKRRCDLKGGQRIP